MRFSSRAPGAARGSRCSAHNRQCGEHRDRCAERPRAASQPSPVWQLRCSWASPSCGGSGIETSRRSHRRGRCRRHRPTRFRLRRRPCPTIPIAMQTAAAAMYFRLPANRAAEAERSTGRERAGRNLSRPSIGDRAAGVSTATPCAAHKAQPPRRRFGGGTRS